MDFHKSSHRVNPSGMHWSGRLQNRTSQKQQQYYVKAILGGLHKKMGYTSTVSPSIFLCPLLFHQQRKGYFSQARLEATSGGRRSLLQHLLMLGHL